jgi:drug/metabolite transporter (DMT)-like permease
MSHHWGYVAVSAILFGVSSTLNKITLENVNPTVTAGLIYFVVGVFLFALHLSPLSHKILTKLDTLETETTITKKDFRVLAAVIVCGSIIAPLLLLNGLNQTTAINASLLLNAGSLFTVAIAFIFLNERCAKKRVHWNHNVARGGYFLNDKRSISEIHLNREYYRQSSHNRRMLLLGNR